MSRRIQPFDLATRVGALQLGEFVTFKRLFLQSLFPIHTKKRTGKKPEKKGAACSGKNATRRARSEITRGRTRSPQKPPIVAQFPRELRALGSAREERRGETPIPHMPLPAPSAPAAATRNPRLRGKWTERRYFIE